MSTSSRVLERILAVALSSVLFAFVVSNVARASAVDVTSFASIFGQNQMPGWSFVANEDIIVTASGHFDDTQQGLAAEMRVGIWTAAGSLLGDVVIAANGGTLDGFFGTSRFRQSLCRRATLM